ncbi:hypothetical protein [Treponema denticola]|uniref:Lipoprotein n=1 Tax=Treponema denticola SP33 TaxID=999437 RepID=M2BBZ0_TREDN|nr:hypothetical protein [Treponema denticola]EMB19609.1 hypothetical protein HMPREF9733_02709 [Treponema denticola SP33]EPF38034.1 hypothetical protein HMPREF9732_00128 [Treponema denticola SP32]
MKKIVFVGLIALLFGGCMQPTKKIVIQNNSDFLAELYVDNIVEDRKISLYPHTSVNVSLITPNQLKHSVEQLNITRNHLNFISDSLCSIENNNLIVYTIVNETIYDISITELNNLFDECNNIPKNSYITNINVYSPSSLNIKIKVKDKPLLDIPFQYICLPQDNKIIIKL